MCDYLYGIWVKDPDRKYGGVWLHKADGDIIFYPHRSVAMAYLSAIWLRDKDVEDSSAYSVEAIGENGLPMVNTPLAKEMMA